MFSVVHAFGKLLTSIILQSLQPTKIDSLEHHNKELWYGLWRFDLIPRDNLFIDFLGTTHIVHHFWRRTKLFSFFFKKEECRIIIFYFCLDKLIHFLSNKISLAIGNLSWYLLKLQFTHFQSLERYIIVQN